MKPFLNRTTAYESTLVLLQDIIDNWLKVQAAWLYLEPIFSSDDIMKQIPTEGRLFKTVDATWIDSMAQTAQEPALLSVVRRPNLLESLIDANVKLEIIQKGLSDYLETKRLAFPRFFFWSLPARKSPFFLCPESRRNDRVLSGQYRRDVLLSTVASSSPTPSTQHGRVSLFDLYAGRTTNSSRSWLKQKTRQKSNRI